MKNSIKKAVALATVAVMLLCMAPFVYAADFSSSVSSVTAAPGQTVMVDVKIDSNPYEAIHGYSVFVKYDTDALTYEGYTAGSIIPSPSADLIVSDIKDSGSVYISFSSAFEPIVSEGTVATISFTVSEDASGVYDLTVTPEDGLLDGNADAIISFEDMPNYLVDGTITVDGGSEPSGTYVTDVEISETSGKAVLGTSWEDIVENVLPKTATATLSDSTTKEYDVVWTEPENFADAKEGEYPIKGSVTISDYSLEAGVSTSFVYSLKLTESADVIIKSCETEKLTVGTGLSASQVLDRLPDTVTVTGDAAWNNGSTTGKWPVTWTMVGAGFVGTVEGDYTFTGTLTAKEGFIINATPKAIVTVEKSQNSQNGIGNDPIIGAIVSEDKNDSVDIKFVIGSSSFTMNGKTSYMDVSFMYNDAGDRTLVPVRFISEALGYTVEWDEPTQTVTIKKDKDTIVLNIGSETMYSNGIAVTMDTAPIIHQDRTFVPIRFVAENFGLTVGFDEATKQVSLTK